MSRIRPACAVAALLVAAVTASGCTGGTDAVDQAAGGDFRFVSGTRPGTTIATADRKSGPEITGDLLDGGRLETATLRGKVVVLNFWGSWCAPCRVESPEFAQVSRATAGRGVQFLGIDVKDSRQDAAAFVTEKKIGYPSLFDPNGRTALRFRDFRLGGLPNTIVLDRHGRVAAVYVRPLLADDIQPVVTRLAAES